MKKISLWALILTFAVSLAQAQETATQQQLDKLSGQIQDILDAQAQQGSAWTRWKRKFPTCATKSIRPRQLRITPLATI